MAFNNYILDKGLCKPIGYRFAQERKMAHHGGTVFIACFSLGYGNGAIILVKM